MDSTELFEADPVYERAVRSGKPEQQLDSGSQIWLELGLRTSCYFPRGSNTATVKCQCSSIIMSWLILKCLEGPKGGMGKRHQINVPAIVMVVGTVPYFGGGKGSTQGGTSSRQEVVLQKGYRCGACIKLFLRRTGLRS